MADSGKKAWETLMELTGWLLSVDKDISPCFRFAVIGVAINLAVMPEEWPYIYITQKRLEALEATLQGILKLYKLGCGEAASLGGKLGFSLSSSFGRFGRCRLKPIMARAYSRRTKLSRRLFVCLKWWLMFLAQYKPRPIPTALQDAPLVISYSDGEGGLAGIGAAVWSHGLHIPLAVYTEVPTMLREYWEGESARQGFSDIFLVEALGPLILLLAFPSVFRNCLWIHFIDNTAAEASLIRGSSSLSKGDHVVGLAWELMQRRSVWAYFDRVESKANPVDGISRRRFNGPWQRVHQKPFPLQMVLDFARSCGDDIRG